MKQNINEFTEQLLNDNVDAKKYCRHLEDGMEYFEENYEGYLASEKLSLLIDKTYKDKDLQFILTGLLFRSDKESITDEIFKKLLKFRSGLKKTYMGTLAHCDISFYQLMAINKMQICFEAFGWIIHHMYISEAFSTEDILQLLKDSEYIKPVWKDTFKQLLSLNKDVSFVKNELLNHLLNELN